jgi:hypothetical protein
MSNKLPRVDGQNWKVLKHLAVSGPLTSWEAIELYKITRLPNRISELRHKYGFDIKQIREFSDSNKRVKWEKYYMPIEEAKRARALIAGALSKRGGQHGAA